MSEEKAGLWACVLHISGERDRAALKKQQSMGCAGWGVGLLHWTTRQPTRRRSRLGRSTGWR